MANSFAQWVNAWGEADFVITHPEDYELSEEFTSGARITHDQDEALKGADFVYVKNWSTFNDYGKIYSNDPDWMLTEEKLQLTNGAKVMHCLPVRRNVELSDEILDGPASLVTREAGNRVLGGAGGAGGNPKRGKGMTPLFVIKIGGNVIDHPEALSTFLNDFASIPGPRILIHGGGKIATRLGEQLGISANYVQGRRITDDATIDLVTMVYGGLVNKQVVAALQAKGCNAIGLTGGRTPTVSRRSKDQSVRSITAGWGTWSPHGSTLGPWAPCWTRVWYPSWRP